MRQYNYKIQWLFFVGNSFISWNQQKTQNRRHLYSVIRALGAKSLTKIVFRDENLKILDTYSSMIQYCNAGATIEAIKYIKKQLKKNDKIYSVELVRY